MKKFEYPTISDELDKSLKRGQVKLAKYPNDSICLAAKNLIGEIRYFDIEAIKTALRFSLSKSQRY